MVTWPKDSPGQGHWLRGQTEHAIVAVRGKPVVTLTNETTLLHPPFNVVCRNASSYRNAIADLELPLLDVSSDCTRRRQRRPRHFPVCIEWSAGSRRHS
jgi:N6-adenosine-specific RNA methylase IME4